MMNLNGLHVDDIISSQLLSFIPGRFLHIQKHFSRHFFSAYCLFESPHLRRSFLNLDKIFNLQQITNDAYEREWNTT